MRIIVVDDNYPIIRLVIHHLENMHFTDIVQAKDGKEGFEKIIESLKAPNKKIDMGIVDWNMPVTTGLQMLQKVRSEKKLRDFIFIMLTAETDKENVISAIQAGVDQYIVKPFTGDTLHEKLEDLSKKKAKEIGKEFEDLFAESIPNIESRSGNIDQRQDIEEFANKMTIASEIAPWSYVAPLSMGEMYMRFKKFDSAERWLRKTIAIDFGVATAHELLSQVLRATGKISQSLEEIKIAVTEQPRSGKLKLSLGNAYLRNGQYQSAINALQQALKLIDKNDAQLMAKGSNIMGKAKMGKGESEDTSELKEEALADMKRAIEINPDFISAHYDLMVAYQKTGKTKEALKMYDLLKSAQPSDAEGWMALGMAYLERNDSEKAMFAFKNSDGLANGRFEVFAEIAKKLFAHKLYSDSIIYTDKARECNPSDIFSYNLKGIIYRRINELQKAAEEYKRAVKLEPDNAVVHFNMGVVLYMLGQKQMSIESFTNAKNLDPNLTEADDYLKKIGDA